jgi:hypothetical protein
MLSIWYGERWGDRREAHGCPWARVLGLSAFELGRRSNAGATLSLACGYTLTLPPNSLPHTMHPLSLSFVVFLPWPLTHLFSGAATLPPIPVVLIPTLETDKSWG